MPKRSEERLDKNEPNELFTQLYEALKEDAPDISAMQRSLEDQGVDVEATLSEGLRLFADFKKRNRLKGDNMQILGTWERVTERGRRIGCEWVDGMAGVDVLNRVEVMARYGELVWDQGIPDLPVGVLDALHERAAQSFVRTAQKNVQS